MTQSKYTVVCDFAEGTYVSQFVGSDTVHVARQWAVMLESELPIPQSSVQIATELASNLNNGDTPTALGGLRNVWQMGGEVHGNFWTVTIVKTA